MVNYRYYRWWNWNNNLPKDNGASQASNVQAILQPEPIKLK
jgi:hypothetical protein